MKVRDVLDKLHRDGWIMDRQKGSHRQFVHPHKHSLRVTISGHPKQDVPKGTLNSIYKQAGWK